MQFKNIFTNNITSYFHLDSELLDCKKVYLLCKKQSAEPSRVTGYLLQVEFDTHGTEHEPPRPRWARLAVRILTSEGYQMTGIYPDV